jgi:hypothetical protein
MNDELPNADLRTLDLIAMPIAVALAALAQSIDAAADRSDEDALKHAIAAGESLRPSLRDPAHCTMLDFYTANAWAGLRCLRRQAETDRWEWEQSEVEKEIIHLRRAVQAARMGNVADRGHLCPMLTNLGNLMNTVGRFVEAIAYWNEALSIDSAFGMARGGRGYGLWYYARSLHDRTEAAFLLRAALRDLREALTQDLEPDARTGFAFLCDTIERALDPTFVTEKHPGEESPKGVQSAETRYRRWSLAHRLFLNSMNDIGESWSAAHDSLTLPSIVVPLDTGPIYPGLFNQMKQEFVSARYLLYEAENSEGVHFADRDVLLFNTLDYPAYSLATEKLKCAFRLSYSLLDKIAYFLNAYLSLGISDRRVSFRTLWYEQGERKRPLRPDFRKRENWPLRGLFWLSKDLSEDTPDFVEALEPDARDIAAIRNHLEHKYLKLHDDLWSTPDRNKAKPGLADSLAKSMHRADFAARTLRLMQAARAALIYLSLTVWREERSREASRDPSKLIGLQPLDVWEDDWKQ